MEQRKETPGMEIVLKLACHIENPCSFIHEGEEYHIRDFYLERARDLIPNLSNPSARDFLQTMIDSYSTPSSR